MYVIDCGTNKSTIYDSETDSCRVITHEELLELPNKLPEGSVVVSEYSHLGCERTRFSRSQPFTARELLNLYYDPKMFGLGILIVFCWSVVDKISNFKFFQLHCRPPYQ